jgi:hypothetical protein
MKTTRTPYYEYKIHLGSKRGYNGPPFSETYLLRVVGDFQADWDKKNGWTVPFRVSRCTFLVMDYVEAGFELAAINYPRFPRTTEQLESFCSALQEFLLLELGQNRITLTVTSAKGGDDEYHSMMEKEQAEVTHK